MIDLIRNYLDNIFANLVETEAVLEAKKELFLSMEDKYNELVNEGKSESDAFATVISEFGDIEEITMGFEENLEKESENEETVEQPGDEKNVEESEESTEAKIDRSESIFNEKFQTENDSADFKFESHKVEADKSNLKSKLWGIVLIGIALTGAVSIALGEEFDIFDIFFDGWWTMFLIIPGLIGIITKKESKTGSIILLVFGLVLLIDSYVNIDDIWSMAFVAILLFIGLGLIRSKNKKPYESGDYTKYSSTSSKKYMSSDEIAEKTIAILGSSTLSLRNVEFTSDVHVECIAILGEVDIDVPTNVRVISNGTSLLGDIDDKSCCFDKEYTLFVDYTCILGEVKITN